MTHVLVAVVALALVAFLAAHTALIVFVFSRPPRYRGLVALAVPPLAPYWAWQGGLHARVYLWLTSLAAYTVGVAILAR
jgi:uncharacterized membrane protein YdcZ (DUF606 family)